MDPFVTMYYLKKAILVYQFAYGVYPNLRDIPMGCIEDEDSFCDVAEQVTDYINNKIIQAPKTTELMDFIAQYQDCKTLLDVVECCDFDVITSKHHGRKFFNEIYNEEIISFFIDEFERIWEVDENGPYFIEVYDLNDHPIYFATMDDLNSMVNNFDIAPYTAFETVNGASYELWSA